MDQGDDQQPLFVKDGRPLRFCIHESVTDPDALLGLLEDIEANCGNIIDDDAGADIVLFDPQQRNGWTQDGFQNAYNNHRDPAKRHVVVHPVNYVRKCISRGKLIERVIKKQRMPGIPLGTKKVPFTEDDDEALCQYLAKMLPLKEMGGRFGNGVYMGMVANANYLPKEYAWARRHSYHSWRTRYKNNKDRMDARIQEIVDMHGYDETTVYTPVYHRSRTAYG